MAANITSDSTITVEFIKLIPSLLWVVLIGVIFLYFKDTIRDKVLPNLGSIKGFGMEITIIREAMDKSIEKWDNIKVDNKERSIVLNRAKRLAPILQGAKILWISFKPETLNEERSLLSQLGISVDFAKSINFANDFSEVQSRLEQGYDLILSDLKYIDANGEKKNNNLMMEMAKREFDFPVIFYVGMYDKERGTPAHAFGITDRPDQMLHLVFDVLERKRS